MTPTRLLRGGGRPRNESSGNELSADTTDTVNAPDAPDTANETDATDEADGARTRRPPGGRLRRAALAGTAAVIVLGGMSSL
ncbi:predicted protein [Streptomyces viridosporus ATCC 14672]|uniref:Predicted protein n=1 Tax=Streptomyces viridosporus (strain ATCC 14672 / DSM 40746 / JCM 4963 / KCTC 9882 / NRRL B-12104 / FH 1290) TaxID=566461 RepID=D6A598_STRV1|nr:predicted protein [Streptomyces viridosporus ATCC 14672]